MKLFIAALLFSTSLMAQQYMTPFQICREMSFIENQRTCYTLINRVEFYDLRALHFCAKKSTEVGRLVCLEKSANKLYTDKDIKAISKITSTLFSYLEAHGVNIHHLDHQQYEEMNTAPYAWINTNIE